MDVEVVREMPEWGKGDVCLVRKGDAYFIVSSVFAPYSGYETLAFPATPDGNAIEMLEVAGGRGASREETIAEIEANSELGYIDVKPEQSQIEKPSS